MKRILLSVAVFVLTTTAFAQPAAAQDKKKVADVAKFDKETIEMGKLKQGNPTKGTFTVTNISKEPLIIEQANPTCGCTISDYTKSPIEPGKTGVINATYNAANAGSFEKHLTVKFAGIDEIKTINLKGEVIANPDANKPKAEAPKPAEVKPAPAVVAPVKADDKAATPATKKPIKKKTVAPKKEATPATETPAK